MSSVAIFSRRLRRRAVYVYFFSRRRALLFVGLFVVGDVVRVYVFSRRRRLSSRLRLRLPHFFGIFGVAASRLSRLLLPLLRLLLALLGVARVRHLGLEVGLEVAQRRDLLLLLLLLLLGERLALRRGDRLRRGGSRRGRALLRVRHAHARLDVRRVGLAKHLVVERLPRAFRGAHRRQRRIEQRRARAEIRRAARVHRAGAGSRVLHARRGGRGHNLRQCRGRISRARGRGPAVRPLAPAQPACRLRCERGARRELHRREHERDPPRDAREPQRALAPPRERAVAAHPETLEAPRTSDEVRGARPSTGDSRVTHRGKSKVPTSHSSEASRRLAASVVEFLGEKEAVTRSSRRRAPISPRPRGVRGGPARAPDARVSAPTCPFRATRRGSRSWRSPRKTSHRRRPKSRHLASRPMTPEGRRTPWRTRPTRSSTRSCAR